MIVKLMNADGTTRGGLRWYNGTRHTAANPTETMRLCSNSVIHFYEDEFLAALMNPAHANFENPIARRFAPEGEIVSDGTKSGCRAGTTYEVVPLPTVTTAQRVRFAIFSALEVYHEEGFTRWAHAWLDGTDRSAAAAHATAHAAAYAHAAHAAVFAADAAAHAAVFAAHAAVFAADAAAHAAAHADGTRTIDFVALAHRAVAEEPKEYHAK